MDSAVDLACPKILGLRNALVEALMSRGNRGLLQGISHPEMVKAGQMYPFIAERWRTALMTCQVVSLH